VQGLIDKRLGASALADKLGEATHDLEREFRQLPDDVSHSTLDLLCQIRESLSEVNQFKLDRDIRTLFESFEAATKRRFGELKDPGAFSWRDSSFSTGPFKAIVNERVTEPIGHHTLSFPVALNGLPETVADRLRELLRRAGLEPPTGVAGEFVLLPGMDSIERADPRKLRWPPTTETRFRLFVGELISGETLVNLARRWHHYRQEKRRETERVEQEHREQVHAQREAERQRRQSELLAVLADSETRAAVIAALNV
jgi:hypothetical protein